MERIFFLTMFRWYDSYKSNHLVQQHQEVLVQLPSSDCSNITHSCLFYCSQRFGKRLGYRKEETYSKRQRKEPSPEEEAKPQFGANNYSNDGSFLEKFYKMQGMKGKTRCDECVAPVLNLKEGVIRSLACLIVLMKTRPWPLTFLYTKTTRLQTVMTSYWWSTIRQS